MREGNNEAHRGNAGRTEREHDFFDHQPCLPTVRRTHEGLRMLGQVRQELALGMGVGTQHYEKTRRQSKRCGAQTVVTVWRLCNQRTLLTCQSKKLPGTA